MPCAVAGCPSRLSAGSGTAQGPMRASRKERIAMNSRKPGYTAELFGGRRLVLILAACGGGGGSSSSPTTGSGSTGVNTPATQRVATIAQHADSLLIPSQQVDVTIRVQGQSDTQRISERFRCAGVRCEGTETGAFVDLEGWGTSSRCPATCSSADTTSYSVDSLEAIGDLATHDSDRPRWRRRHAGAITASERCRRSV